MEIAIGVIISILGATMGVLGFAFNRKDRNSIDVKDQSYHLGQIDTKLERIDETLAKIEKKLDSYDEELENRIQKAISSHIKEYHKGE